jgi:hypothetical protein
VYIYKKKGEREGTDLRTGYWRGRKKQRRRTYDSPVN